MVIKYFSNGCIILTQFLKIEHVLKIVGIIFYNRCYFKKNLFLQTRRHHIIKQKMAVPLPVGRPLQNNLPLASPLISPHREGDRPQCRCQGERALSTPPALGGFAVSPLPGGWGPFRCRWHGGGIAIVASAAGGGSPLTPAPWQ